MKNRKAKSRTFHRDFLNKNQRGFLLAEETLKIIIAVISISFLAYLLTSIYLKNKTDNDLELARASLEHLIKEANAGANSEKPVEVEIWNPSPGIFFNWYISSWSGAKKPLSCSNLGWKNCLCICFGEDSEDCNKKGICRESDVRVERNSIEIKNPLPLNLQIKDGAISEK